MNNTCIRTLAISILILALAAAALAQADWVRQSPIPTGRNLNGAAWATADHGFAVGEDRTLVETLDGGATWRGVGLEMFEGSPLYNVACLDANTCIVIGNSGTNGPDHFRTTDGGETWNRITDFPLGGSWYHIDFVTPAVGFMGSNGATARTTDAGATWELMSGFPDCPVMYGMDFRDEVVGLVGGNRVGGPDSGPGIFKTTDAGVTWIRKFASSANDVLWLDATTAIATIGASIYRSTDEGETWTEFSTQVTSGLYELARLPNGTVVGVAFAGEAWRSTDGGLTWNQTLFGLGGGLDVSFFDDNVGSIVGHGGLMYRTTDGGITWQMVSTGIGGVELQDLEMFDDNTGFVVGDRGYILRTDNAGQRWIAGNLGNQDLNAVSIVDDQFVVIAGDGGGIFKSFDRGQTWQDIRSNIPQFVDLQDVKFIDRNLGYAAAGGSSSDGLYRTTDGGATWSKYDDLNAGHTIDFVGAQHGWVFNLGGLGYRTIDGGETWEQMLLPEPPSGGVIVNKIDFINENEGWAAGWYGYVAHTIDGGRTWQLQEVATQQHVMLGLNVVSPTEAFAMGAFQGVPSEPPAVFHTNDAGETWTQHPIPAQYSLSTIHVRPSRQVWAAGFDGAVFYEPEFIVPEPSMVLTFDPTRVIGGSSTEGTVRLSAPAPAGGATVELSSGDPTYVTVPASVTIAEGSTSVSFAVTTQPVDPNTPSPRVAVTATYNGDSDAADLVVAPPFVCTYAISPASEYFGATGGVVVVNVTTQPECAWEATTNRSFITFPDGDSGVGSGRVTLAVSENTVTLFRFGSATIAGEFFNINQAPAEGCVFGLSSTSQNFDSGGGTGNVDVTSPSNCFEGWKARSNEDWITVDPTAGMGNATISYTVAANTTGLARTGTFTVSGLVFTITQSSSGSARTDYDGDGRADLAVYRPSELIWYLSRSALGFTAMQFGLSNDRLVPADYDGDGRGDIAVYRPSEGNWYIANSSNGTYSTIRFGNAEDTPIPGDFDGDGNADLAVFRANSGTWYYRRSIDGETRGVQFGQAGDIPMTGDRDGDGKTDVAVFRPATGYWYWLGSAGGQLRVSHFGQNGDIPVTGDFNGDGRIDLAVFRPSNGIWYVAKATGVPAQNFDATHFGLASDTPVPADYDGDGKTDIAVFRNGVWYINQSTGGFAAYNFGLAGDVPVAFGK